MLLLEKLKSYESQCDIEMIMKLWPKYFKFFHLLWNLNKNQISRFPCCSFCVIQLMYHLFFHLGSILNYNKQFSTSKNTSQNLIPTFSWKEMFWVFMLKYFWKPFHYVSFTTVRLILNKLGVISALQNKSKFNFDLFWNKNQILMFPCCWRYSWRPFQFSSDVSIPF